MNCGWLYSNNGSMDKHQGLHLVDRQGFSSHPGVSQHPGMMPPQLLHCLSQARWSSSLKKKKIWLHFDISFFIFPPAVVGISSNIIGVVFVVVIEVGLLDRLASLQLDLAAFDHQYAPKLGGGGGTISSLLILLARSDFRRNATTTWLGKMRIHDVASPIRGGETAKGWRGANRTFEFNHDHSKVGREDTNECFNHIQKHVPFLPSMIGPS